MSKKIAKRRLIAVGGWAMGAWILSSGAGMAHASRRPALGLAPVQAAAAGPVTLPVTFTQGKAAVASFQFSLALPTGWKIVSALAGPASSAANKSVSFNAANGTVIVFGLGQNPIASGVVATVTVQPPAGISAGSYPVTVNKEVYSDPKGATIKGAKLTTGTVKIT